MTFLMLLWIYLGSKLFICLVLFSNAIKISTRCPILEELHIKDILLPVRVAAPHTLVLLKNFQYLPNLIRANIYNANASVLSTLCCRAQVLRLQMVRIL
jgi:hypothetical protein